MKKPSLNDLKIRKATLKDCKTVWQMGKTPELVNPKGNPPKRWWIESFVKEKQIFFIAEINKKIAGFVFGERTAGNVAILQEICVKKQYREHGIGHKLLNAFENESKKRKLNGVLSYAYSKGRMPEIFEQSGYSKGSLEFEMLKMLTKK